MRASFVMRFKIKESVTASCIEQRGLIQHFSCEGCRDIIKIYILIHLFIHGLNIFNP